MRAPLSFAAAAVAAFTFFGYIQPSHAVVIDFAGQVSPTGFAFPSTFSTQGFTFTGQDWLNGVNSQSPPNADGKNVLSVPGGFGGSTASFFDSASAPFSLQSLDVMNWPTGNTGDPLASYTITGHIFGGGTETITGSLILSGPATSPDLTPTDFVTLTPNWTNLASVDIFATGFNGSWLGVSNIILNQAAAAVPEPASASFVVGALLMLYRLRRSTAR